jgi:hypothetical protein
MLLLSLEEAAYVNELSLVTAIQVEPTPLA